MNFYEKFLGLCDERGLSKQKACQLAGLSGNAWIRWANGSRPGSVSLHKVCEYFGVSVDSMVDDSQMPVVVNDGIRARQELLESTEMKILFDAAKGIPAYKLYEVASQLMKWKGENGIE